MNPAHLAFYPSNHLTAPYLIHLLYICDGLGNITLSLGFLLPRLPYMFSYGRYEMPGRKPSIS